MFRLHLHLLLNDGVWSPGVSVVCSTHFGYGSSG